VASAAESGLLVLRDEIDAIRIFKSDWISSRIPDRAFVRMRCAFQHIASFPKIVEASAVLFWDWTKRRRILMVFWGQMPFTYVVRGVPCPAKSLSKCFRLGWKRQAVVPYTISSRVHSRKETRPRRPADRLIRDRVGEVRAFGGHGIEIWRKVQGIAAIASNAVPTKLVGDDQDYVRPSL